MDVIRRGFLKISGAALAASGIGLYPEWVTRAWLKKQHPKWLREMEEAGRLKVFGEEKKAAQGH